MVDQTDRFREAARRIIHGILEGDFPCPMLDQLRQGPPIPIEALVNAKPRGLTNPPKFATPPAEDFVIGFLAAAYEQGRREAMRDLAETKRAHVPQRQAALRGENIADDEDVAADAAFEAAELAKRGDEPW